MEYDYIVVGAGSAGCTLANRLSEDRRCSVLLLEAGTKDSNLWIHVPAGFTKTLTDPSVNWLYETEPEEGTANRPIPIPRGKVLGGSSSINGMLYIRGQHRDYDIWAQQGNRGWSFDDVLPYFKRSENRETGGDEWHGEGGPLHVSDQVETHEVCDAVIAAAQECGIPRNDDVNGAQQEGFGYVHLTVKDGKRHSAAKAYLDQARERDNLDIATAALGKRVIFEGKRAVGVEYSQYGDPKVARARKEVILAGGSVNSPQLLELSGIGQGERLRELGIQVLHDLPGVGENLQDHYVTRLAWRVTKKVTFNERTRGLQLISELFKYLSNRKGVLALSAASIVGFARVRPGVETPDVQYHMTPASYSNRKDRQLDTLPGMTIAPCQLRPESRGSIHAKSADPFAAPAIRPNFLAAQTDRDTIVGGMQLGRQIIESTALNPYRGVELMPGADVQSYDEWLDYARQTGATIYHPIGTCKMGSDNMAVVDDRLRVHGIENLRVVDASVMPTLVSGNTNAPTIMIAEKASDMIREDAAAS
jgi:choline dehydrogenase